MKQCTKCNEIKPREEFNFKNKSKDILHSQCKQCQAHKQHELYLRNIDKYKSKAKITNRQYKTRNKDFVRNYKAERACLLCRENTPEVLDFHHTSTDKEHNIANLAQGATSIKTLLKEIDKCVVLCANCHRKVHAGLVEL